MRVFAGTVAAVLVWTPMIRAADVPVGIGDNDRVVFYGDKTVDPPGFGFMVESFVRVRYPESKARYWHIGTRDFDTTEVANARFDEKLATLKPTVVVLSWGIGDGEMKKPSDERLAKATSAFETLVSRCVKLGAKVYVLTPPCPTVSKKNILSINDYDVTLLKIAEAYARVAAEKGATVLDWYAATAPLQKGLAGPTLTEKDGLYPSPKSDAMAAKMILDAWTLKPIDARIDVDWSAGTASSTQGQIELTKIDAATMLLELTDFPMPYYSGKRKAAFNPELAVAVYCRMMLHVENLPGKAFTLAGPNKRRTPIAVSAKELTDGYNLAVRSPLTQAADFTDFFDRVQKKNEAFSIAEQFEKRYLRDHPPEPELVESYKTYILSRRQLHEGMVKIIERKPRTLTTSIIIRSGASGSGR